MSAAEELGRLFGQIQPVTLTEGITNRQLSRILKDASAEAGQEISKLTAKGTFSAQTRAVQLAAVQEVVDPISTHLWSQTGKFVEFGAFSQGALAADQILDLDLLHGMPASAVTQYAKFVHYDANVTVQGLLSRRDPVYGKTLSDRIYANGKASTAQVGRIVDRALVQQLSARELAGRVKGFYDPSVPGGASYAAMRLARTEINNAHHFTTIKMNQDRPWVMGFKWNLSDSHPEPDPCDDLAEADHYNLGPGVYIKEEAPERPHPNCLCYLTTWQEDIDAFINKLTSGEYDPWLEGRGVRC